MKVARYLSVTLAAVVGMVCTSGWLTLARAGDITSRRAAALSHVQRRDSTDPILSGTGAISVPPGTTQFFFAETGEFSIAGCKEVEVKHADGSVFDSNNSGKLVVHGIDVAAIFFDKSGNLIGDAGSELAATSPNGPLFADGYAVTSPQRVDFLLRDFSTDVGKIAIIFEGDVTNTDTIAHAANSAVNAVIGVECFD